VCRACWGEYGSPAIDTPAVREAAASIRDVYEWSGVGGNLHVEIDDWNLEDRNFEFDPIAENVHESGPDQLAVERRCWDRLKALTEDGRASALALYEGFWGEFDRATPGRSGVEWVESPGGILMPKDQD
jgi:hypothetical protein